jgi:hypothetical protein
MAFSPLKVSIVNIYSNNKALVSKIDINMVKWVANITGKILCKDNLNLGPYAIRIVNEDQTGKTALAISYENIKYNILTKEFTAEFKNDDNKDKMKKQFLEVYLREKPDNVKYGYYLLNIF